VTAWFNFLANSEEVTVSYSVNGLDTVNATDEYLYHIHTNPIPPSGDCKNALGHLDPLQVTDVLVCDPTLPQYCQEGDLSGKHGKLPALPNVQNSYTDPFLRFWPQPLSLLGRSIVIHLPNLTRIACGNITSFLDGTADADGNPTNASSNYVTNYPLTGAPAPTSFINLFSNGQTNTAAAASATVPGALPDVESIPNAILTTTTEATTVAGSAVTTGVPEVIAAASLFTYTGQALPTQSEVRFSSVVVSGSGSSASATATGSSGSTSGAGRDAVAGMGVVAVVAMIGVAMGL
jgi:hypothetical protein